MREAEVEEVAEALLDASRLLMGITLRAIAAAPVPLTVPQHRLLVVIDRQGLQRIGALADDLGVNQSNASRLVDRLVAQGLLERTRDPEDGRASLVSLTDEGERTIAAVNELRLRELRRYADVLPPSARTTVARGLRRISGAALGVHAHR